MAPSGRCVFPRARKTRAPWSLTRVWPPREPGSHGPRSATLVTSIVLSLNNVLSDETIRLARVAVHASSAHREPPPSPVSHNLARNTTRVPLGPF